jgi:hypothetical protein
VDEGLFLLTFVIAFGAIIYDELTEVFVFIYLLVFALFTLKANVLVLQNISLLFLKTFIMIVVLTDLALQHTLSGAPAVTVNTYFNLVPCACS